MDVRIWFIVRKMYSSCLFFTPLPEWMDWFMNQLWT